MKRIVFLFFALFFGVTSAEEQPSKVRVRVGHFSTITHGQGVIGHYLTRQGEGWFEKELGEDVVLEWHVYNAGPSSMEAILVDSIDMAYIGPSPTINAYLKTEGEDVRIVCGACSGGAALVVHKDGKIKTALDFKGKKIGTPQFGNTQDVAARSWLMSQGLKITKIGGDAFVIPTPFGDQFLLFKKGDLDAVWTIEPWVSKLILDASGVVFLEEKEIWKATQGKYVTAHLVCRKEFLLQHPDLVKKWIKAHLILTQWMNTHGEEAQTMLQAEIHQETRQLLPEAVIKRAWDHVQFTYDPIKQSLYRYAQEAFRIGFIKEEPDLKEIYDLRLLNEILREEGESEIH